MQRGIDMRSRRANKKALEEAQSALNHKGPKSHKKEKPAGAVVPASSEGSSEGENENDVPPPPEPFDPAAGARQPRKP